MQSVKCLKLILVASNQQFCTIVAVSPFNLAIIPRLGFMSVLKYAVPYFCDELGQGTIIKADRLGSITQDIDLTR